MSPAAEAEGRSNKETAEIRNITRQAAPSDELAIYFDEPSELYRAAAGWPADMRGELLAALADRECKVAVRRWRERWAQHLAGVVARDGGELSAERRRRRRRKGRAIVPVR